jgi:hypothetical protein
MKFSTTTAGRDPLNLRQQLEQFANSQWIPAHYTPDQAAAFVLDQFKRTVAGGLEQIELRVEA